MPVKMSKPIFKVLNVLLVLLLALAAGPLAMVSAASNGPLTPSSGDVSGTTGGSLGNVNWSNPSFVAIAPGTSATALLGNSSSSQVTHDLVGGTFGFQIPTNATIDGITLRIGRMADDQSGGEGIRDNSVTLRRGATSTASKASATYWGASGITEAVYGGSADLWGLTWTPAQINAADFKFALSAINDYAITNTIRTASVDYVNITVNYTVIPLVVSTTTPTYGDTITLTAKLWDGTTGANNRNIAFTLDSVAVTGCTSVKTNASGIASCTPASVSVGGPYVVGATFAGDAATVPYFAATSGTGSLTVGTKTLTVTGVTAANRAYNGGTVATLDFTGASLVGVVSPDVVTLDSSAAAGSFADASVGDGKTVTISGLALAGTNKANYTLTAPTATANITRATQTITVNTHAPASAAYGSSFSVAATSDSSLAVSYSTSGACLNVGTLVTMTAATGTCSVNYNQVGNTTYSAATQVVETVTAGTKALTATGVTAANRAYNGGTVASLNFSGAALVGVVNPDVVTLDSSSATGSFADAAVGDGKAVTIVGLALSGTDKAKYTLTPPTPLANITKAGQTITVNTHAPASAAYKASFDVAATSSASLTVAYSVTGPCTIAGASVTMTAATGTCQVNYDQAGNGTYNAATQVVESVTAAPKALTVTGITAANRVYNGGTVAVLNVSGAALVGVVAPDVVSLDSTGATGSFLNPNVGDGKTVTVAGLLLSGTDKDKYSVTAPTTTANITKADQTITIDTHAPASAVSGASFTVAASSTSGLAVSYSTSGVCSILGAAVTMTSDTGTCQVKYNQAGDGNYNAAPQVSESVTAIKANQTITVNTHAPASAVFGALFNVAASASSSLAVSYSTSGACTNVGGLVTMTSGTGTCVVKYDQAGGGTFTPALQVTESVTASKAAQSITVDTHAPGSMPNGKSFTVAASSNSDLAVSYSVSGVCTIDGSTVTMTSGTGTCLVKYDQTGDLNYNAADQVVETVTATEYVIYLPVVENH